MTSNISVDRIMSKIYGPTATQETATLVGGNNDIGNATGNIFYVNHPRSNINNFISSYKQKLSKTKKQVVRKRKGGNKKPITVYADIKHFEDKEINEYIHKLYLEFYTERPAPASIIVIPSKTVRSKMYDTINKLTKGIESGSYAEKKAIIDNEQEIGYKKYIFNRYGDNTKDQPYRIGTKDDNANNEYPNTRFDTVRRTNAVGEIYYFSYVSDKKVKCATNMDGKNGTELEFVCRCINSVYYFIGDLPKDTPNKTNTSYRKLSMKGGTRSRSYVGNFVNFVKSFETIDDAAEAFVIQRYNKDKDFVRKYLNCDKVYTMFSCALHDIENNQSFNDIFETIRSNTDRIKLEQEMIKDEANNIDYSNDSSKQIDKIKNAISRLSNGKFNIIKDLSRLYKNKDKLVMRADLMTSLYRNGMNDISELLNMTEDFNNGSTVNISAYNSTLLEPFIKYPMTSVIGKNYIMMCNTQNIYNTKRKTDNDVEKEIVIKDDDDDNDIYEDTIENDNDAEDNTENAENKTENTTHKNDTKGDEEFY